MGALEFRPATARRDTSPVPINIAQMVDLASDVLSRRRALSGALKGRNDSKALHEILMIGTSAGGARAKAVLAWNPTTGAFGNSTIAGRTITIASGATLRLTANDTFGTQAATAGMSAQAKAMSQPAVRSASPNLNSRP